MNRIAQKNRAYEKNVLKRGNVKTTLQKKNEPKEEEEKKINPVLVAFFAVILVGSVFVGILSYF
ncbi:hypothetical protein HDV06_004311 [Boothiomyces sp. JEL0866]|nr:hypothetical protein HDV06_004311 [Boothiomyces sp. JEL0866]